MAGHVLTVYGKGGKNSRVPRHSRHHAMLRTSPWPLLRREVKYRVFNQFTEQFKVERLAAIVEEAGRKLGYDVVVRNVANPRIEKEEHYYNAVHTRLLDLGLKPHYLSDVLVDSILDKVARYRDRLRVDTIEPWVRWGKPTSKPSRGS